MFNFFTGAAIGLIAMGVLGIYDVVSTWRFRSERNYQRFSEEYASAAARLHEARQAGERA